MMPANPVDFRTRRGLAMAPLFSLSETLVFWLTFFGVFIAVITLGPAKARWAERQVQRKRLKELSPLYLALLLLVAILIGYARIGRLPHWLCYIGEALFVAGYAFTGLSIRLLGRYYSLNVEVLPDHVLIEKGPYGFIRHPNYLGQLVGAIGLGLALQSWVAVLVLAVGAGVYFGYRMRIEEAFLVSEVDGYADYRKRTKFVLPFIL